MESKNMGGLQTKNWVIVLLGLCCVLVSCNKSGGTEAPIVKTSPPPPNSRPSPPPADDSDPVEGASTDDKESLLSEEEKDTVSIPPETVIAAIPGATNPELTPPPLSPELENETKPNEDWAPEFQLVLGAVHESPMARLFNNYLFNDGPNKPHSSRALIERIYSHKNEWVPLSALQLIVEDLDSNGHLGPTQIQRLVVLYGDLKQSEKEFQEYPGKGAIYPAIATAIAIVPFGFPSARKTIWGFIVKTFGRVPKAFSGNRIQAYLKHRFENAAVTGSFQPRFVIKTYFTYVAYIEIAYLMWYDFRTQISTETVGEKVEAMKDSPYFDKFLTELSQL